MSTGGVNLKKNSLALAIKGGGGGLGAWSPGKF